MVGTVVRPHGLRGEVLVYSHSDSASRFSRGQVLVTGEGRQLTIQSSRATENGLLVRFEEVSDRNATEALGKVDLFIEGSARRSLGPDEYWPDELIGLEVRSEAGDRLGTVTDVDESGIQTRLVVGTAGGQRLVPLVAELVPEIQLRDGFLVLRTVPGLLNDDVVP